VAGETPYHVPVLAREVVELLQPRRGGVYVDGTLGGGGHAAAILDASAPDGRVIGMDWDEEAVAAARERLGRYGERVTVVGKNFAELEEMVMALGLTTVDGVLFDLGVSSHQFDEPARGFSVQRPGPLEMRMSRQLAAGRLPARLGGRGNAGSRWRRRKIWRGCAGRGAGGFTRRRGCFRRCGSR